MTRHDGLEALRKKAEEALNRLLEALSDRMRIVREIGELKRRLNIRVEDYEQEARNWRVINKRSLELGLPPRLSGKLYSMILAESLRTQGSWSREALAPGHVYNQGDLVDLSLDNWAPLVDEINLGGAHVLNPSGLEEELVNRLNEVFNISVSKRNVCFFPSLREALRALLSEFGEGRGVVIYGPSHPWIRRVVWEHNGRPYLINRDLSSDCQRFTTPRVLEPGWLVILEAPEYNTGLMPRPDALRSIVDESIDKKANVVSLEVNRLLSIDVRGSSVLDVAPSGLDRLLVVGCGSVLSGSLNTGVAWVIGHEENIRRLGAIRDLVGLTPGPNDLYLTKLVMDEYAVRRARELVTDRVQVIKEVIKDSVGFCEPRAGPHVFMWSSRFDWRKAIENGVKVAPGEAFGEYPYGFRLTFLVDKDTLLLGLGRLLLSLL